jgi:hypothetical protein
MASVRADRVIDNWTTLIEGGARRGENLYDAIHESLKDIPDIAWNMDQVRTGLLGSTREFMVIKQDNYGNTPSIYLLVILANT